MHHHHVSLHHVSLHHVSLHHVSLPSRPEDNNTSDAANAP
jgi:hypothetical protein